MGLFSWIRTHARDAFLAGIGDAVKELQGEKNGHADAAQVLRLTLAEEEPLDAEAEPARPRKGNRA